MFWRKLRKKARQQNAGVIRSYSGWRMEGGNGYEGMAMWLNLLPITRGLGVKVLRLRGEVAFALDYRRGPRKPLVLFSALIREGCFLMGQTRIGKAK
jgi:hypothetical protein